MPIDSTWREPAAAVAGRSGFGAAALNDIHSNIKSNRSRQFQNFFTTAIGTALGTSPTVVDDSICVFSFVPSGSPILLRAEFNVYQNVTSQQQVSFDWVTDGGIYVSSGTSTPATYGLGGFRLYDAAATGIIPRIVVTGFHTPTAGTPIVYYLRAWSSLGSAICGVGTWPQMGMAHEIGE